MDWLAIITMTVLGGYASFLANQKIASIVNGYYIGQDETKTLRQQTISRVKQLVPIMIGLFLPLSLFTYVLSAYLVFIIADIIGGSFKKSYFNGVISGLISATITFCLILLINWFSSFIGELGFFSSLATIETSFSYLRYTIAIIPCIAIGRQFGFKKTIAAIFLGAIIYFLLILTSMQESIACALVMIIETGFYIILSIKVKSQRQYYQGLQNEYNVDFSEIKKKLPYLMIMSGMIAFACAKGITFFNPLTHIFHSDLLICGLVSIVVIITSINSFLRNYLSTRIYNPLGLGLSVMIGYFFGLLSSLSWIGAVVVAMLVTAAEVVLLPKMMKFFDYHEGFDNIGKYMNSTMIMVTDFTTLIGSVLVINLLPALESGMLPVLVFLTLGLWIANRSSNNKILSPMMSSPVIVFVCYYLTRAIFLLLNK